MCRWAALIAAVCPLGCESSSQCLHDASEAVACTLTTGACDPGTRCDNSLECTSVSPQTSCYVDADRTPQCRPGAFDRLALQDGFQIGGMQISLNATRTPQVIWQSPHDAEVVACALFVCNPAFVRTSCSPNRTRERNIIANFDQCVLLFRAAPAEQAVFALIDENASHEASQCPGTTPGRHVVTKLAAGCWAYDTTSVIAASELVPVSGSLLPDLSLIPHDQPCPIDGDDCYNGAADRFGVCIGGTCTPRCRTGADCALAAGRPSSSSECTWSCEPVQGNSLGACVKH
jgi:hypothetical protein